MRVIAIDPGPVESAYVVIDSERRPLWFDKVLNVSLLRDLQRPGVRISWRYDVAAIEQIGHYGTGMPAGRDVFDTCRWIGRFEQVLHDAGYPPDLVLRATVKTHLCGTPKAKDPNVTQALVDRFAPGQPNHGKGTKAEPGWFYGFRADVWAAYALAVYVADTLKAGEPL